MDKNIDIRKIEEGSKTAVLRLVKFSKTHVELILIVVFLCTLALWIYIFFAYAYQVVFSDPENAAVVSLKVKEAGLKDAVSDIAQREENRQVGFNNTGIENPFLNNTQDVLDAAAAQKAGGASSQEGSR